MAKEDYSKEDGVWRTIGGRKVFIRKGQSLADAMIESGKFKGQKNKPGARESYREEKEKDYKEQEELYDKYKKANEESSNVQKEAHEYMKKVTDNNEKYEDTYEKRKEREDRQEQVDKERGKAEPLREQYRQDKGLEEYANKYKEYREEIDKYGGLGTTEKSRKLSQELGELEKKYELGGRETIPIMQDYDLKKQSTNNKNKSYDVDMSDTTTEEYNKRSKEIGFPRSDEHGNYRLEKNGEYTYKMYDEINELKPFKEALRKAKDEFKNEQSTNETMNNAIREKASKGKVYTLDDGTQIDQNYMKQLYSGRSYDDIKRQNEVEKEWLDNVKPEMRERQEAFIKETDKYLDSMEKYESRISDDFSTKERETGYPFSQGTAWEGTKSNSGLYGKDKIKAIDDEIKKAYPNLKTSRKTAQGGMTDSFSYSITESDKPIIRDISDFSDTEIERLYNEGYNRNWYNTKEDFKDHIKKELESGQFDINQYHIDNDYRLTPYGKQVFKDIMKVSNAYNYDESDSMTDYFNTGHYISLHVGKDGKPYQTTNSKMNDLEKKRANKGYGIKYNSMDEVFADKDSALNQYIRNKANEKKAYRQYLKDHPESKMSLKEFRNMKK